MSDISDTATAARLPIPAPAAALVAFGPGILNGAAVRRWLYGQIHQHRAACPHCRHEIEGRAASTFWNGGRVACKDCRAYFTAATATALSKSKLSEEQFFLLMVSMALDLDTRTTAAMIDVNPSSIRENRLKIELSQKGE